jgi:hypothetical protein
MSGSCDDKLESSERITLEKNKSPGKVNFRGSFYGFD